MFYSRIEKVKKPIAWLLFFTFYLQLISPVLASSVMGERYYYNPVIINQSSSLGISVNDNGNGKPIGDGVKLLPNPGRKALELPKNTLLRQNNFFAATGNQPEGPGPTQPEMQSFQSVNSNNLVDLFTGDFSYNIPLLDVGGYPVSLHYTSGITMDQEASWVGLGWNINPGTINRNMRGLPDDFNGEDQISKTLKLKDNKTIGLNTDINIEIVGFPLSFGASYGVFHNSYNGWGSQIGTNVGISAGIGSQGALTASLSVTNNSQTGLNASPSFGVTMGTEESKMQGGITIGTNYNSRTGLQGLQMSAQLRQQSNSHAMESAGRFGGGGGIYLNGEISFAKPSFTPTVSIPFTSKQFTFKQQVGGEIYSMHPNFSISGSYSNQYIEDEDTTRNIDAYGYLYTQKSEHQQDALLDFNREKEVAFRGSTPNIAVPGYTYDIYSISGEGIGGMFRPYRNDIGMIYDHTMTTKSKSGNLSLDYGFGSIFHGGADINVVLANTTNNEWRKDNVMSRYIDNTYQDSLYENVYFKNPGEKVAVDQSFFDRIGDDKLARVELSPIHGKNISSVSATRNLALFKDAKRVNVIAMDPNIKKTQRDKRTQVISYLTADLASKVGLDTVIKSYGINKFPTTTCTTNDIEIIKRVGDIRKGHHLSEITVLNTEGKRYVYGIPAYNVEQQDVCFAVNKENGNNSTGLVTYTPNSDNTTKNANGIDNYYNREKIPAYAHSFLLSAILSPDYSDLTGDGITEDDNGDAVKFNYTRVYGGNHLYQWRAPYDSNKASYNEGLKTYSRDDKGSYSYGKKEVWYMNSIESKTMIATFVLEKDTTRLDGFGTKDENGGRETTAKLYRLREINLYAKSDFLKNGPSVAKPIKTIHFAYSYELCSGMGSSVSNTGKLTLKKIWFSYNNNNKGKQNPYVFSYYPNNQPFTNKAYDRWGNYKDPANNPGPSGNTLTNAEYPYSLQKGVKDWDSAKAAIDAAPWTLNQIKLPSGGTMKITYESDDYAYVQNRRAMQMFSIFGLGYEATDEPNGALYKPNEKKSDYLYLFVKLQDAVANKNEIKERYLDSVTRLYFKLFVKMPEDRWGSGYEQVPCFADIDDYGIKAGYSNKVIWIKIKDIDGRSPLATAAIQYMRINLPSKAFPYSEPGDDASVGTAVSMALTVFANLKNSIDGFEDQMRKNNICHDIDTAKSFVRLQNPYFKKFGGGLRVKKVEILDNWNNMTSQPEATYGQYYDYTTMKTINGTPTKISSGVASYEPVLGREENPFYQPIPYAEHMAPLGPTDYVFTEEPLGEMFFPAPNVGYSRVAVQTINNTKRSANGVEVTEFYTAYDFPTLFEYTALDDESKKPFSNPLGNFFKFNAKRFITLSQGFKVELNDMHGKLKSQLSYAQTNLLKPLIATYNYYKLDNDNALNKHLSNTVSTVDSATGMINTNTQMGKDIDIFIDARQQVSKTISASKQLNLDYIFVWPPVLLPSMPSLPSFETNRYRSIAVTKVVNRYGILDSVVHIDKGSTISTKNMVYDGETGNVILSQTQNEFNDPVYSFNYPAYWAYSGMGSAYKNIGAIFYNASFTHGKLEYHGLSPLALKRYFESGDEIYFQGYTTKRYGDATACITSGIFTPDSMRIWAIDVAKSGSGNSGIYFIDKDGIPIEGHADFLKIIRSGKRNLTGTSAGSIMCLANPIKIISGRSQFVFDSTTSVVNANAVQFKDTWQIDSTRYRKDTVVRSTVLQTLQETFLNATDIMGIDYYKIGSSYEKCSPHLNLPSFIATSESHFLPGGFIHPRKWTGQKSSMGFPGFAEAGIPKHSVITQAKLLLYGTSYLSQFWERYWDNSSNIARPLYGAMSDYLSILPNNSPNVDPYYNRNLFAINTTNRIYVELTYPKFSRARSGQTSDATAIVQDMFNSYYNSNGTNRPSLVLDHVHNFDEDSYNDNPGDTNQIAFRGLGYKDYPALDIYYYLPCDSGSTVSYSATPVPGYYCISAPRDSFVCRSILNDSAFNPYRWGTWGNWRSDRSYVYYNLRKDSVATSTTNIRKDGQIVNFRPYWSFTNAYLLPTSDSSRWVWNSEINLVNSKGLELQNHDPLDRYNSAEYGYNQTLPVAVTQNSLNREMMFDGFEDYNYRTDTCKSCPGNRFINMVERGTLVDTVSHTGLFSLRIAGNDSNSVTVPVIAQISDSIHPHVHIIIDSTTLVLVPLTIAGKGTGLTGQYTNYTGASATSCVTRLDSMINFTAWGKQSPDTSCVASWKSRVVWTGYIQPRYSELYRFQAAASNRMQIWIGDSLITKHSPIQNISGTFDLDTMTMIAGKLYPIKIVVNKAGGNLVASLKWASYSEPLAIIPTSQLYTSTDTTGTSRPGNPLCENLISPKQSDSRLPNFSPTKNSKIIVGAWVKEKGNNADTVTAFRNVQMQLIFNGGGGTVTLRPSGNIIEGWQRIEDTLTIPLTATLMTVRLKSTNGSVPVYFDDIRIHPYNANMKSYVYHPINLRLMAELDENNYASFYEYDDDGTLNRVKKETIRGIKTIKETRSALLNDQ